MTKPTPRSELVKAVRDANAIIEEAIPLRTSAPSAEIGEVAAKRAAALPVILRELLDVEVE